MKVYALTNVGRVRPINEDAFFAPQKGERFAAVADGMGGHQAGEVASALAIEVLGRCLRAAEKPTESAFEQAIDEANRVIYEASQTDRDKRGMGTTLTALWFGERAVYLGHVGDSRAYLLRNHALMQLSTDHSLVNELLEKGEITPSQARVHPKRNFITRALGSNRHVMPDILRLDTLPGDVWLLCSDGLSNHLRSADFSRILQGGGDGPAKLQAMIDLALERGGNDNITAMLVTDEEAGA